MALRVVLLAAAIMAAAARPQGPAPVPEPVPAAASSGAQQGGQAQPPAAPEAAAPADAGAVNLTAGGEEESVTITYPPPTTVQECRRELNDANLKATQARESACPAVFRHTDCIKGLGLAESAALVALAYSVGMGCTCAELLPQLTNARGPLGHRFGRPQTQEHHWAIRAAELVLAHRPLMCTPNYDGKNATHGDGHQDDPWLSELYHELAWRSAALNKTANATTYAALASGVGAEPGTYDATNAAHLGVRLYQHGGQLEFDGDVAGADQFYKAALTWLAKADPTDDGAMLNAADTNAVLHRFPEAIVHFRLGIEAFQPTLEPYMPDLGYTETPAGVAAQEKFFKIAGNMDTVASKISALKDLRWLAARMDKTCLPSDLSGTEVNVRSGEAHYWDRARCYWTAATLRGRALAHESDWEGALREYEQAGRRMQAASERFQRHRFTRPGEADKLVADYAQSKKYFALGYTAFWSEVLAVKLFNATFHPKAVPAAPQPAALEPPGHAAPHFFSYGHSGTASGKVAAVGFSHSLITEAQKAQLALLTSSANSHARALPLITGKELASLSPPDFQRTYIVQNRPVVVEDLSLASWPAADLWTDLEKLAKRHGRVLFAVSSLPFRGGVLPPDTHQLSLADFVDQVMHQKAATAAAADPAAAGGPDKRFVCAVLGQYHPMSADIGILPHFIPGPELNMLLPRGGSELEFFLGPALAGQHPNEHTASWSALLSGRRWWFLWPRFCRNWAKLAKTPKTVWDWVQEELPALRATDCAPIEFVQTAGQVVLVPSGWGYAVLNIEPSMSVQRQIGDIQGLHLGQSFVNSSTYF